jgi:hypothetical protein
MIPRDRLPPPEEAASAFDLLQEALDWSGEVAREEVQRGDSAHLRAEDLRAYLARELSPEHSEVLTGHLMGCPDCAARVRAAFLSRRGLVVVWVEGSRIAGFEVSRGDGVQRPLLSSPRPREDRTVFTGQLDGWELQAALQADEEPGRWRLAAAARSPERRGQVQVYAVQSTALRRLPPQCSEDPGLFRFSLTPGEYELQVRPGDLPVSPGEGGAGVLWRVSLTLEENEG